MNTKGQKLSNQIIISNFLSWITFGIYPLIIGIMVLCNLDDFKAENRGLAIAGGIVSILLSVLFIVGMIIGFILKSKEDEEPLMAIEKNLFEIDD